MITLKTNKTFFYLITQYVDKTGDTLYSKSNKVNKHYSNQMALKLSIFKQLGFTHF